MSESVPTWKRDVLQAAGFTAGCCTNGETVGIDFVAQDDTVFAHAHFDPAVALELAETLVAAVNKIALRKVN